MAKVLGNVSGGAKVLGNVKADPGGVAATVGRAVRGAAALAPPEAALQAAGASNPSSSLMAALASSTADLGGNVLQGFDTLSRYSLPAEVLASAGAPVPPTPPPNQTWLGQAGKYLEGLGESVGYQPSAPFESIGPAFANEGVLGGLGTLGRFMLEQGATSIPHMLGAVAAPVPYGLGVAQDIAETRAENNQSGDVTVEDLLAAAPAAVVSAFLDRFGGLGVFKGVGAKTPLTRVLGAGWREAWTEFLQEQAQYAGETVGTAKPWDIEESLMRGAAGAVGGAGLGGAGRGVVEVVEALAPGTKPPSGPLPIPVQGSAPGRPPPAGGASTPPPPTQPPAGLKIGETVGLRTPNARGGFKVINAVPEKVEGDVVFWRDEDGVMNTDLVQDFMRDSVAPVAPKKPPVAPLPPEFAQGAPPVPTVDPLAGAEPEATPAPRRPREVPLLEGAPVAVRPAPPQPSQDVGILRRAVQAWDEGIYKAEDAFARGLPGAKSSDEIEAMRRAREEAAGRLAAAMAATAGRTEAVGAEADQAVTRVQAQRQAQNVANQEAQAADADAAMQRVGRLPRPTPAPGPQTVEDLDLGARKAKRQFQGLVSWIAARGGMRDPGGELRAMDLQRRPGFIRRPRQASGNLMGQRRGPDAWDPDYVREAAIEAGYLPEGASTADLYDAIGADLRGEGPVASADIGSALDYQDAADAAAAADRYEQMYGTDETLADLRFNADRLGLGWESDATAADIQAAIDERLALMDADSVDAAERLIADAERAADEALAAEPDSQAEMEEDTDAEPEPAFEDRTAETEDGQAGQEAAEGRAAPAPEPEAEGDAGDERAAGPDREEATAGDERPVLESVVGPREPDRPRRPFIRPVTARGRDAINRRVQAERWKNRRENERRRAEGRSDAVPEISADEEAEVQAFTQFLGDHLLKGIGLGIVAEAPGERVLGNFDPEQNIVTVFRGAVERGMFSRTMMHELWHAMEGNLTMEAREAVIGEWRRQAERYMLRREWMQAFAERGQDGSLLWVASSLPADDTATLMATQYGQRAVAVGAVVLRTGGDGKARAYVNWTADNYRLHNASEFFAEALTDRFEAMRADMDAFAGSVFEFMRAIWNRIVAALRRLFGADVMADIFNGFRDGAITVPEQPLPPIYEQVLEGNAILGGADAGPDRPLGSAAGDEAGLQQLQAVATGPAINDKTPFKIGLLVKYLVQGTWLASRSKEFAQLYQAKLDEHYLETRLIHDGGEATAKSRALNDKQKKTANAILEVARLAGINIVPTGRRLAIQVPQVGVGGMTMEPALSKPGDVLVADMQTTEAIVEVAAWLGQAWFQIWGAKAMNAGYKGEFTAPGIAQAKADAIAANDKVSIRLAEFAEEMYQTAEQNQRDGYIPFMRYGDTAITVKDKNAQPGDNPVVYMTLVDTDTGIGKLRSGKRQHKAVARKVKELQAQYSGSNFEIEIGRPGERDVDALDLPVLDKIMRAAMLDRPAAAVKEYQTWLGTLSPAEQKMFKDIAGGIPKAARRKIIEEIKNGLLKRSRNVPGYETDFIGRSLLDYNRAVAGMVAKSTYRDRVEAGQKAVYGDRETKKDAAHPTVVAWTKKWEAYIDGPENDFWRHGRFLGFYMNMFGSISSAMVNATSTLTVSLGQMTAWAGPRGAVDIAAAMQYGVRGVSLSMKRGAYVGIDKLGVSAPLLDALKRAEAEGVISAGLTADLYGKVEAKYDAAKKGGKALQAWLEIGASFFNYAEQYNRITAYIAAWKAAQRPAARKAFMEMHGNNERVQEMVRERGLTPETIATFFVEDTQFVPGQIDRSSILRGAGGLILQFKQYMLNYLRLLGENLFRQGVRGKVAGMIMLLTMALLSGLLGLPGLEDILLLMETTARLITGSGWSAETWLREMLVDALGSPLAAELATRGFSREFLGTDLSSRIGIGRLTPEMEDPLMSIPILAGTWGRIEEASVRFNRGETAGGTVALLSPFVGKGVADFLRGIWVLDSEGYITRSGTQKFAPSDITWGEKLLQMAGLRPARFARTLEYDYAQRRIATQMAGPRGALMDELANAGYNAQRARANGDEETALYWENELIEAWDDAWEAYTDPSTPPERLVKPPEWRDVMRAIQDRESEFSRLKRAPKLAREAMQDVPYVRE